LMEIDGVPLTGKLFATDLTASYQDKKLVINWKSFDKNATAKIWLAVANQFKSGGSDHYELLKVVPLSKGKETIDVSTMPPSSFYKSVLETPGNFLNRWVTVQ